MDTLKKTAPESKTPVNQMLEFFDEKIPIEFRARTFYNNPPEFGKDKIIENYWFMRLRSLYLLQFVAIAMLIIIILGLWLG